MKNINILVTCLLIFSFSKSFSQVKNSLSGIAHYTLTHHYDTLNYNIFQEENFVLLLGKNSSLFKSRDKEITDSLMENNRKRTGFMAPISNARYTEEKILFNFNTKTLYTTSLKVIGDFKIKRDFPNIEWDIKSQKKKILGYNCQQATGNFHGRKFSVWFTNELPFTAGPWKLVGLPGLIVEAEDATNRIKFVLKSFQNKNNNDFNIEFTENEISWLNYMKLAKAMQENPQAYLEQKLGRKISTTPPMLPLKRSPILPNYRFNYPLEAIEFYTKK